MANLLVIFRDFSNTHTHPLFHYWCIVIIEWYWVTNKNHLLLNFPRNFPLYSIENTKHKEKPTSDGKYSTVEY